MSSYKEFSIEVISFIRITQETLLCPIKEYITWDLKGQDQSCENQDVS